MQAQRCSAAPISQGVTAAVIYVGIDLGKRQHAVCFLDEAGQAVARPLRMPHTGRGLRQLHAQLACLSGPHQVIMEASGAHWMGLARKLRAAGLTVHIVNPLQTAGLRKVGISHNQVGHQRCAGHRRSGAHGSCTAQLCAAGSGPGAA